jgi:hypothetical protein
MVEYGVRDHRFLMNKLLLCACLAACFSVPLRAQFENTVYVPPYNPGLQLLNDSIKAPDDGESEEISSSNIVTEKSSLGFTLSKSRTVKNLQNIADKIRATDPAQAD